MFYFRTTGPSPQLSVTSALAKAFGVSDAWFGSCPTQTYPNRFFLNCATSGGYVQDVDYLCNLELLPTIPNIFELLDKKGGRNHANWRVYFHDFPIAALNSYVFAMRHGRVSNFDTSDYGPLSSKPTFLHDVRNKSLARYSLIEPRYITLFARKPANDNHPPHNVLYGEILVGKIYNILRGSSYYWPRTLLIITYDEHGGCYDHVIPPAAVPPDGTTLRHPSPFQFNRYGPRVPAILVSPYIAAGSIIRPPDFSYLQGQGTSTTNGVTPFDHTSIIKTIVECFQITKRDGQPANLTQRDKIAPSLADALTLGAGNMNNGPAKLMLPIAPRAATVDRAASYHLGEIYQAMLDRHRAAGH